MSSLETGRGQKVNREFIPARWLWPSVFNTSQPTAQLGFFTIIYWQSREFHNAQSTTKPTCGSPGDARNDEPAWTCCRNGTKPNLKEKTVAMKLSPPQTQNRGSAKLHCSAAGLPDTTTILATSCQGTSAAIVDFGSLPNQNHSRPLRREWAGCCWRGMERGLLQDPSACLVKD